MKTLYLHKYLTVLLLFGCLLAGCNRQADDVAPARMSQLLVNDDHVIAYSNNAALINVLANDSIGGQAAVQFMQPVNGTLQADSYQLGRLYYLPHSNFTGADEFSYQICINNHCETAKVHIEVKPGGGNSLCQLKANPDRVRLPLQTDSISVRVLANDSLCSGMVAVPQLVSQPKSGSISSSGMGTNFRFLYTNSTAATHTTDIFRYRICQQVNGQQVCSEADVEIIIP